ncbi:hypothetical protein SCUCBS95973_000335 [Sporothrix curviconia]|uniref:Uncharacterized protein n=1 Tax=Sporothrix curviconia TaxID=1260050 RepID=A0ABP0APB0_9PEZI
MRHVAITGASSTSARDEDGLDHPQVLDQQHEALTSFTCQESSIPAQEDLGMQATQPQYSQGLESQRVPLEVIRMLGPQTDRSDIIISIHPEQIRKIVSGTKDHEFLSFKIPHTVTRFWIYASRPVCELQFMAVVAAGFRQPGEIDSESGIGNADFNAGRLVAKFAYKLVQVYQLNNPVSLDVMKKNGWAGPPRRYDYLPPAIVGSLLGNLRCALFEDASEPGLDHSGSGLSEPGETPCAGSLSAGGPTAGKPGAGADAGSYYADTRVELSVSQEIEAQLLSDISDTQVSRNMQPLGLMSSQAQAATPAMPPSTSHAACRSQATTATAPATQEMPSRPTLSLQDADTTQDAELATVSRLELDLGQSSVAFARDGSGKTTSHADDADSTSQWQRGLYEEVRQAPPAVILDWEDSDDEE